jgi:hypothetical protein
MSDSLAASPVSYTINYLKAEAIFAYTVSHILKGLLLSHVIIRSYRSNVIKTKYI